MKKTMVLMLLLTTMVCISPAHAVLYGFEKITQNGGTDIVAQLTMDVTSFSADKVLFVFGNSGPINSVISEIYFDMTSPFPFVFSAFNAANTMTWVPANGNNGTGVLFATGANPNNLPAGNTVAFVSDTAVSADNPAPKKGINPSESLGIEFSYLGGANFESIIDQLNSSVLRVGLHVTGIPTSDISESFVNKPNDSPPPVPEPGTLLLLGSGLLGLAWYGRKRKSN